MIRWALIVVATLLLPLSAEGQKPDWQNHLDWSMNDTGPPNCPELYLANANIAPCLALNNRYCLMSIAIGLTQQGGEMNEQLAMGLALISQCHNGAAQQALIHAGVPAVAAYLRQFNAF